MGSVQRWFRAEPIGLMRWGAIETAQLIQALNDKFKGIGELENTTLGLPYIAQNNLQYFVYDSTYTMEFHTFVDKGTISEEVLLKKSCRQLKYLRAKLIRDLEAGNKIFVYRPNSALNGEDIVALGAAMKTYGDAKLLIIQVADSEHCSGDVGFALPQRDNRLYQSAELVARRRDADPQLCHLLGAISLLSEPQHAGALARLRRLHPQGWGDGSVA